MFYLFIGFYVSEFLDKARTNIHDIFCEKKYVIRPFYQLLFSIPKKFQFHSCIHSIGQISQKKFIWSRIFMIDVFFLFVYMWAFFHYKRKVLNYLHECKGIAKMIFIVWFQWRWIFSWTVAHLLCLCSQKRVENNFTKNGCCKWLKIKASNAIWKDPIDQPHPTSMVLR